MDFCDEKLSLRVVFGATTGASVSPAGAGGGGGSIDIVKGARFQFQMIGFEIIVEGWRRKWTSNATEWLMEAA